jgi:transposase
MAELLLDDVAGAVVIADKGYDSDALADGLEQRDCRAIIPPRSRRNHPRRFGRSERRMYRKRHRVECFFQRLKRFRPIGTRYEKRAAKFLAMILLASCLLWSL